MRASNMLDDPTFATGMRLMSKGMAEHFRGPDAWTRVQVYEAWGITPDEQVCLEEHLNTYELVPEEPVDELFNYTPLLREFLP